MSTIKDIPVEKGEAVWIVNKETNEVTDSIIVRKKEKTRMDNLRDHLSIIAPSLFIISTIFVIAINYKKANGK
jgi:outer membrane lipoprotein-sorting protein